MPSPIFRTRDFFSDRGRQQNRRPSGGLETLDDLLATDEVIGLDGRMQTTARRRTRQQPAPPGQNDDDRAEAPARRTQNPADNGPLVSENAPAKEIAQVFREWQRTVQKHREVLVISTDDAEEEIVRQLRIGLRSRVRRVRDLLS
jgi:hypothetical protein